MPDNAIIRASIDEATKVEASAVLAGLGMTVSDAVRHMLKRVARDKALPFDPPHPMDDFEPGPITRAAMEEARRGGLKRFDSVEALMADLNADD